MAKVDARTADGPTDARADAPRVLSLLSASTEIVHRIGCGHLLIGRSHGCDDPPLASTLPIATAPRVDPNAASEELDAAVRAQSVAGGPIYQIRNDLIRTLKPDVILTQEQCRICAVTPEDVAQACAGLPAAKMVTIMPVTLDDVMGDVLTIAKALGVEKRGERLVRALRRRLGVVREVAADAALEQGVVSPPTVAHVEWLSPLMGSGYWIAECVESAGCKMVHGSKGGHSPTLPSLGALSGASVILLAPCGFSIERTHSELQSLGIYQSAEWRGLPAVRAGRVYVADGNLYFNRSSCGAQPRTRRSAHPGALRARRATLKRVHVVCVCACVLQVRRRRDRRDGGRDGVGRRPQGLLGPPRQALGLRPRSAEPSRAPFN